MVDLLAVPGVKVMGSEMEKAVEKVVPDGGDKVTQTCAGLVPLSSKAAFIISRAGKIT